MATFRVEWEKRFHKNFAVFSFVHDIDVKNLFVSEKFENFFDFFDFAVYQNDQKISTWFECFRINFFVVQSKIFEILNQ
jgi:hypothetical protein